MKYLLFLIILIFGTTLDAQDTYSKKIDLDSNALRNYLNDFSIFEDKIYTYSTTFCDLQNTGDATCVGLTKFDNKGNILESKLIDTLNSFGYCFEGLAETGNNLIFSSYLKGEKFKKVSLYNIGDQLSSGLLKKYAISNSDSDLLNTGVENIDDYIYIYGSVHNQAALPDSIQIIKIDDAGNEIWRKYYTNDNASLKVNGLQGTPDGNLAFIMELSGPPGNNDYFDGYHIMKIDTAGILLDSFVFEDNGQQPNRLLSSSDGSYYFSSLEHPLNAWDPLSYGMINKMDANMDILEWSLILPNNQLVDGRHYRVYDYIEAKNGDIIACGMAYDNTDTDLATGVPDKNSTWNGFIIRLTSDGEIKWLRLYKNDNDLLPHDEYGKFRPSKLDKIKELPDGRLVGAGNVYVNNRQFSGINETDTEGFHLWLLMVDEHGCLEGEECEEIIRIDGEKTSNNFQIGTKWTYESINHPASFVGFEEFEIVDTSIWHGEKAFVIEPGLFTDRDYMVEKNNRIYFWDDDLNDYQLNYDYSNDSTYYINYYNLGSNQVDSTIVYIDSINIENINGVNHTIQYCRSKLGYGNIDRPFRIINKVGSNYRGPRLPIGLVIDNITNDIQRIRCYENDIIQYNFTEVACDSTWIITSTNEIDKEDVLVYPNPTNGKVYIDGISANVEYQLFSLSGQLIKVGTTTNRTVSIENNGLYILRLLVDGNWILKKIVKIE